MQHMHNGKKQKVLTSLRVSHDTFTKLHFLKQPFETHDDALNRILGDYKEMSRRVAILEEELIKRHGST